MLFSIASPPPKRATNAFLNLATAGGDKSPFSRRHRPQRFHFCNRPLTARVKLADLLNLVLRQNQPHRRFPHREKKYPSGRRKSQNSPGASTRLTAGIAVGRQRRRQQRQVRKIADPKIKHPRRNKRRRRTRQQCARRGGDGDSAPRLQSRQRRQPRPLRCRRGRSLVVGKTAPVGKQAGGKGRVKKCNFLGQMRRRQRIARQKKNRPSPLPPALAKRQRLSGSKNAGQSRNVSRRRRGEGKKRIGGQNAGGGAGVSRGIA